MASTVGLKTSNLQHAASAVELNAPLPHTYAAASIKSKPEALTLSTEAPSESTQGYIGYTPIAETGKRKERDESPEIIPLDVWTQRIAAAKTPTPLAEIVVEESPVQSVVEKNPKPRKRAKKTHDMAPPAQSVSLQDLQDFVDHMKSLPQPVALTEVQRKAIADLKASIAHKVAEPELGDKDWISALGQFRDSPQGRGTEYSFQEYPGDWTNSNQWHCVCTIKITDSPNALEFPREGDGFVAVDAKGTLGRPPFARKKDAKRYAAKCAVEWLLKLGKDVKFPKQTSKGGHQQPQSGGASAENKTVPANTAIVKQESPEPKPAIARDADNSDEEVSAVDKVGELCNYLGFQRPAYKIMVAEPGSDTPFYHGFADFGIDRHSFGEEIFEVKKCFSKKGAKEQIAEKVLRFLLEEKTKRQQQIAKLLAGMDAENIGAATPTKQESG
ncbi:hypothetical protein OQA88_247 [Cercophora sp. LCS_1]